MRRGWWKHGIVLGVVVFFVFACGGIDANELQCEEAVAHLEECCEGIDARRFQCDEEDACANRTPDFYENASNCIRQSSCEQLREKGKCAAFVQIANTPYPSNNGARIQTEACR